MEKVNALFLNEEDNIATALSEIEKNKKVLVKAGKVEKEIHMKNKIDFGHKFAVIDIQKGEDIKKYGEVIGVATKGILAGEHVHVHNIESKRGSEE
ncbi:UxaA family hydrolase [Bacillus dakarensis]|uniref:UxaA family hydrolase n=1 Tax=Robertmurraya dakarensis TaxID=1926278 RepID=UPI000981E636|nr:UxaA family hydrolase [Bacillus dakarensis]